MIKTRTLAANGIEFFLREAGQGPLVLLCHGWPETGYSWRHQLTALADSGFHACAPDMRGYGGTSAPPEVDAYTLFHLTGDMLGLVTALGETKAVIVGHDWGAPVAWHAAMFRPDVFTAVAGLSVPPPRRGRGRPLELLRNDGMTNFYWQHFQPPGIAEAEFERDIDFTLRAILSSGFSNREVSLFVKDGRFLGDPAVPRPMPDWIDDNELAEFVTAFRGSGFRGGLNWYRNLDRNWDLTAPWQGAQIHQPALFIAGAKDAVITGKVGEKGLREIDKMLPNLTRTVIIEGAGHWIQQERPREVNDALIAFLRGVSTQ